MKAIFVRDFLPFTEVIKVAETSGKVKLKLCLPTYNSLNAGYLQQVLKPLLASNQDFHLVVVDDASDDGTLEFLQASLAGDPRISLLRHRFRVGLPAVSNFEALMQGRSEWVGFVFHDSIFEPHAIDTMMEHLEESVFGAVIFDVELASRDRQGDLPPVSLAPRPAGLLAIEERNFIGNAGLVVHQRVFTSVGFYDPHVVLSRLCDWDLWRRILRQCPVRFAEKTLATEMGTLNTASLGNSRPLYLRQSRELARMPRNSLLTVDSFPDRNVLARHRNASMAFVRALEDISANDLVKQWGVFLR